jgi:hypothetical protein
MLFALAVSVAAFCSVALVTSSLAAADIGSFDAFSVWQQGGFRGANAYPPGTTVDDFKVLRSWGANLAEVPVMDVFDPRPPYALQPAEMGKLDRMVDAAAQADLFVVLTCRSGPGRADFNKSQEIWADAEAQDAYARMWAHLAQHYRGNHAIVGYDLMCEPHPDDQYAGLWNGFAKRITGAIRKVDSRTPILVNSIGWAYPADFSTLQPTGDARTVYEVHFYQPHYYTHQKPGQNRAYPGFRVPDEGDGAWDRNTIKAKLDVVRDFQQKYHVPIFAGEFGCARFAPGAVEWLRDQMELYEAWHWSWAYWAFREWDVMDIEKNADASDRQRYADTPMLGLFRSYFARDRVFPSTLRGGT